MHETLAQERLVHFMTIEMGNLCGMPTNRPGGTRATSEIRNVTCNACLGANVDRISAIGESLVRSGCATDPSVAVTRTVLCPDCEGKGWHPDGEGCATCLTDGEISLASRQAD